MFFFSSSCSFRWKVDRMEEFEFKFLHFNPRNVESFIIVCCGITKVFFFKFKTYLVCISSPFYQHLWVASDALFSVRRRCFVHEENLFESRYLIVEFNILLSNHTCKGGRKNFQNLKLKTKTQTKNVMSFLRIWITWAKYDHS